MSLRRRLLVFGYPALELLTLFAVASLIGLGWLLLGLALGVLIGLAVMQTAGRNAFTAMQQASRSGAMPEGSVRRHGMAFLAGALFAIPGIWCKVAALALCIPGVQSAVARRTRDRLPGMGAGVVVEGVVVTPDDMRKGPASAGPPREIE